MSAPPKIETTEIPEKSNQQIDLNECDVCDVKDFAEKPQSERLQILESIFNADCRKRGKSEIRISQILKYIIGKHGVTESVIFEAIQRITTANYKIRESLYAFLVTNREERIFHNGKCVFAPRKEEPTDADTLAPIKAIEKRQSKKPATPITDAEFEALNKKLKEKHAA